MAIDQIHFEEGYAQGCRMCVPSCFEASIKTRTFAVGDLFYDTPRCYEDTWRDALKHMGICIQVQAFSHAGITYAVFKPNKTRTAVVQIATKTASIDDFLATLKEGFE